MKKSKVQENVVHYAFKEGRTTDTPWINSNAKAIAEGMDDALLMHASRYDFNYVKVAQMDEEGNILNVFPNLFHAAHFIVETGLSHRRGNTAKQPYMGVYGNLLMMMRMGWKAYGFTWTRVSNDSIITWRRVLKQNNHNKPTVFKSKTGTLYFETMAAAARYYIKTYLIVRTPVSVRDSIRRAFATHGKFYDKDNGVIMRPEFVEPSANSI